MVCSQVNNFNFQLSPDFNLSSTPQESLPGNHKRLKLSSTIRQNASSNSSDHDDSGNIQKAKNCIPQNQPNKTVYIQLRNNRKLSDLKPQAKNLDSQSNSKCNFTGKCWKSKSAKT